MHIGWYNTCVIIPKKLKLNILSLEAKIAKGMVQQQVNRPYFAQDDIIHSYEALRAVWKNGKSVRSVCLEFNIPRSTYYEKEDGFVNLGIIGLFPAFDIDTQISDLEALVLLVKRSKPKLST